MDKQMAQCLVYEAQNPEAGFSALVREQVQQYPSDYADALTDLAPKALDAARHMRVWRALPHVPREIGLWDWWCYMTTLREMTPVPTLPCPVDKGEQEIVEHWVGGDMDGSHLEYTVLACGHNGPDMCGSGFDMGPSWDPYGVHCELDRQLHQRDEKGSPLHQGHNPLPAPGQEIVMWTGGGSCAGDPLPHHIVGYEAGADAAQ